MTNVRTGWAWMCTREGAGRCVDAESREMTMQRPRGSTKDVVAFCAGLPAPSGVAYEAGPGGFGARALTAAGVGCVVAAPGTSELPGQVRIKMDIARRRAAGAAF